MKEPPFDLRRFEKRLRLGRAVRYSCVALTVGSLAATVWSVLDLIGVTFVEVKWLVAWIAFCGVFGALSGFFAPVSRLALAKSIDKRAGLADRLTSALRHRESSFTEDLQRDAEGQLSRISPATVFPIAMGRRQLGAAFSVTLPFLVFLVSYNHLLLSSTGRAEREAMKAAAPALQHVAAPLLKEPDASSQEKELAKELERLQKELERGSLDKKAAQDKANQISQDAERMMQQRNEQSLKDLNDAESALGKMKKDELTRQGLNDDSLSHLDGKQLDDKLRELAAKAPSEKAMSDLEKQISDLQRKLGENGLSPQAKENLQKQLDQLQKQLLQMKLSDAVKKMLERLQNNPEYQKLLKMEQQMRSAAGNSQKSNQPPMTQAQLDEMEKKLEELAQQLKSDKDIEDYIKKLEEALKEGKKAGNCAGVCACMASLGQMGGAPSTTPGPPSGAHLNMSDKEAAGQGKTHEIGVTGDQRDSDEPTPYVEQLGTAKLTGPSAIPMLKAVPASRHRAEEAINKQKVPKEHQERVKRYFESLEGR